MLWPIGMSVIELGWWKSDIPRCLVDRKRVRMRTMVVRRRWSGRVLTSTCLCIPRTYRIFRLLSRHVLAHRLLSLLKLARMVGVVPGSCCIPRSRPRALRTASSILRSTETFQLRIIRLGPIHEWVCRGCFPGVRGCAWCVKLPCERGRMWRRVLRRLVRISLYRIHCSVWCSWYSWLSCSLGMMCVRLLVVITSLSKSHQVVHRYMQLVIAHVPGRSIRDQRWSADWRRNSGLSEQALA